MKTPVLRPSVEAVMFGFERIGMVIRIAWLPIVLCVFLYVASFYYFLDFGALNQVDWSSDDPETAISQLMMDDDFAIFYLLQSLVLPLLVLLILSSVFVAVTRASTLADYEPPSLPFYFALGPREIKYFIVRILYALLIGITAVILLGLAAVVVFAAVGMADATGGDANQLLIVPAVAIAVSIFFVWLWIVMRFLPVLPIAAVENRIAFGDAWKMSKGNFWRLVVSGLFFLMIYQGIVFALILIIFIPAAIILGLLAAFTSAFSGALSIGVIALLLLFAIPAFIVIGSFSLAAEAAWPARIYAYLSDCGDECKIY